MQLREIIKNSPLQLTPLVRGLDGCSHGGEGRDGGSGDYTGDERWVDWKISGNHFDPCYVKP